MGPHLSATISFETVYKALIVGDGRQLLLPNTEFQLKYRNGIRPAEIYAADFEVNPQFLCFEDDVGFELAVRAGVQRPGKAGRQYLANFFGPKRETGAPIPLVYFAIQTTDRKKLKTEGGVNKILAAARGAPDQLGIDPALHASTKNIQQLDRYEGEPLPTNAIDDGYGLGVMQ